MIRNMDMGHMYMQVLMRNMKGNGIMESDMVMEYSYINVGCMRGDLIIT